MPRGVLQKFKDWVAGGKAQKEKSELHIDQIRIKSLGKSVCNQNDVSGLTRSRFLSAMANSCLTLQPICHPAEHTITLRSSSWRS